MANRYASRMEKPWLPTWVDAERGDAGSDVRFDEYVNLTEVGQAKLYDALKLTLLTGRARQPTKAAERAYVQILGCIAANAIVATALGPRTRVHYSRANTTYVGGTSPYHPSWMTSKLLRQTADKLGAGGYINSIIGTAGPSTGRDWSRSTYEPTLKLLALLRELGLDATSVERDSDAAPVIFLQDEAAQQKLYDPTAPGFADKIASLKAWLAQVEQADIALHLPPTDPDKSAPALGSRLYRRFGSSLAEHGRFYGGWWQNLPKEKRAHITISEEHTVELDFQGLVARMLYHQQGQDFEGDPYAIPEVIEACQREGLDWEVARPAVKQVFNFMLNAKKRGGYEQSKAFDGLPSTLSRKEVVEAVERHHAPVAHRFFKRQALALMNQDSRICAAIMAAGVRDGVIVLPIHDSFIVAEAQADWLRAQMVEAYRAELGFDPVVL
ncbi:MAG: hypothetical protein AB1942_16995 [Pseudomonadota bacterium]